MNSPIVRYPQTLLVVLAVAGACLPAHAAELPRHEFNRLLAHWTDYGTSNYVPFVADCRAQVAQVGFYGASFYSLSPTPLGKGYPMHLPLVGVAENGAFFEKLNRQLHAKGAKVVGHFNVKFVFGDPVGTNGPTGFFQWYRDGWNEKEFGPKPVADPVDLLEKNADGSSIVSSNYSLGGWKEYWGCLNNPAWRAVLKAWMKRGIDRGADGFIANYFYRHNCLCSHCRRAFRDYLAARFTPTELKDKFDIADLENHVFPEIVSWHDPKETTPLRLEMLRFSQVANKQAFDDVFIKFGRSIKPDLIVAQWNHLGAFNQISGDERCLLPAELWGKGEDYLWYSTGGAACYTDLAQGFLGEGTLQARFIRGAFDDKPFTLGKYESSRPRVSIAELAANGGAPMGFYTSFQDPLARPEIVRYYQFLARHDDIYHANRPYAETLLIYPRRSVHRGELGPVGAFQKLGYQLLDAHLLFDIRPDDIVTTNDLARYRHVVEAEADRLPATNDLSVVRAPQTVRVSASRPARGAGLDLHFVNYNRTEPAEPKSAGKGFVDEKPIATPPIEVELVLPRGVKGAEVQLLTPEVEKPVVIRPQLKNGRACFTVPSFLVYCVARVR